MKGVKGVAAGVRGLSIGDRVAWALLLALTALRTIWATWAVLFSGVPLRVWGDTERYRQPDDWSRVFRLDLGMGPGQLVQLIYLPGEACGVISQTAVAGLAWSWATMSATAGLAGRWRWPLVGLLTVLGASPWWLTWDTQLLSESLTLSGCVLFASGWGRLVGSKGVAGWSPTGVGLVLALGARPLVVPLMVGLMVVAVVFGGRELRRSLLRRTGARVVVGVVILWAVAQSVIFNSLAVAHYAWLPRPLDLATIQAADRFIGRAPHVPGYLELAKQAGMPACPEVDGVMTGKVQGTVELHSFDCPEFQRWLAAGGVPWTMELRYNLGPTVTAMTTGYWTKTSSLRYGYQDARFRSMGWRDSGGWTHRALVPDRVTWAAVGLSALALLVPGRRWLVRATSLGVVVGWCAVMWLVDGIEYWRHMLPGLAVLPWLAVAAWVGIAATRVKRLTAP